MVVSKNVCTFAPNLPKRHSFDTAERMAKTLFIIAGCNGAGKTSASRTILPEILHCKEFVNADAIAKGLSPFNPESMAIPAGRLMLMRIEQLMNEGATFSIETTLATRSYVSLIEKAKRMGYTVSLMYFWIRTPELAVQRVARRVREGGHNIPEDVIRKRYYTGLENFFYRFKDVVDYWILVDNTDNPRTIVADKDEIYMPEKYNMIKSYVE